MYNIYEDTIGILMESSVIYFTNTSINIQIVTLANCCSRIRYDYETHKDINDEPKIFDDVHVIEHTDWFNLNPSNEENWFWYYGMKEQRTK